MLKLCLVVGIVLILVWSIWLFRHKKPQPIEKVQVIATYEHLDPRMLQKIISTYLTDNFFNLDTIGLKRDLLAQPWVDKVFIRRKWPNTIIVNIEEQQALAKWKEEALFNTRGMLFTPPLQTFPADLPLLFGPEEEVQDVIVNYQTIQKLLSSLDFKITQLGVDERGSWHMVLDGNLNVFLGDEDILLRLQNFVAAYPKIVAGNPNKKIAAFDLRYKNGVAVHWSQ